MAPLEDAQLSLLPMRASRLSPPPAASLLPQATKRARVKLLGIPCVLEQTRHRLVPIFKGATAWRLRKGRRSTQSPDVITTRHAGRAPTRDDNFIAEAEGRARPFPAGMQGERSAKRVLESPAVP
jgi:hypothetical protein